MFRITVLLATLGAVPALAQTPPDVCAASTDKPGHMLVMGGSENRDALSEPQKQNLQKYGVEVGALIATYGARYVVRSRPQSTVEGTWPAWKGVVISQWPCREAGQAFWHSEKYQNEVIPLRRGAATYRVGMFGAPPKHPEETGQWTAEGGAAAKNVTCKVPVYLLVTAEAKDAAKLGAYRKALADSGIMYGYGAVDVLQGPPAEVLEGDWPATFSAKVTRWPCRAAFDAFYASADYNTKHKPLRANAADFTAVLVAEEKPR
ncbi:MAG: DUF1330 domain-containing protein [Rhodospirillaceae bacterium]|nr:DUF1330 domain-containing protein [Rhodospirillaceae bacterium]